MENIDVIRKLIGKINPIGKSEVDSERFENLKEYCKLVNEMVSDIDSIHYNNKEAKEFSIKRSAEYADNFLTKELGINKD